MPGTPGWAALERWPRDGVPDNPGAWLMATAKHRAVDLIRRRETYARKLAEIGRSLETTVEPAEPPTPDDIDHDLLRGRRSPGGPPHVQ